MKFVHIAGDYACRDGVTFFFRNPTEVENRVTIEKLRKDPDFVEFNESLVREEVIQDGCPKCGRVIKQGRYMHEKYCRG